MAETMFVKINQNIVAAAHISILTALCDGFADIDKKKVPRKGMFLLRIVMDLHRHKQSFEFAFW
jgi:hypothetical protein